MGIVICAERIGRYIKEDLLEDLELEKIKFRSAEEFLLELKKEFGG